MPGGVAGHIQYLQPQTRQLHAVALPAWPQGLGAYGWERLGRQPICRWQVHLRGWRAALAVQFVHPADMIVVMMGNQNGCQRQLPTLQGRYDDLGLCRIAHNGFAAIVQHPDVVVCQSWQSTQLHKGCMGAGCHDCIT